MKNAIDPSHRGRHNPAIFDIAFDEFDAISDVLEILGRPGAQVVQNPHAVTAFDQRRCDVGTDKPAAASYQKCPHCGASKGCVMSN